jgi:hypothetical protein
MKKSWVRLFFWIMPVFVVLQLHVAAKTNNAKTGRVTLIITPMFNSKPLKLNNQYYVNENGDTLYIDLFRFYMTNFGLTDAQSFKEYQCKDSDHLVDAEDTASEKFSLDVPAGEYSELSFIAGVDSVANTSGANNGDLDPVKGMYWAWNSGYIMAKLEGHSKVCKTLHQAFEFHIGGYMPPYNTARGVSLELPHTISVKAGGNTIIRIRANAAAWFSGLLDLATTNDIVIPGKEAAMMADNYAQMFTIEE